MNKNYTLAATAALTGLCACHSSHPTTEVHTYANESTTHIERVDSKLLTDDSLCIVIDSPQIKIIDCTDSSPSRSRSIMVKAKSLRLQRVNSVDSHAVTVSQFSDSICVTSEQVRAPIKSKSTATRTIAALLALVTLLFIAYKLRKHV